MDLVGVEVKAPDGDVAGDARDQGGIVRSPFREEVPHLAGIAVAV